MLIGEAEAIQRVRELIDTVAGSQNDWTTVLISGESGSGKEVAARMIHHQAFQSNGIPFMAVNCSAIPHALFEREMFGCRKGAFTGADEDKTGLAHAAQGGVLFLDEIGDFPVEQQPKLLRMLEDHKVRRVGGTEEEKITVRFVIAATNRPLKELLKQGAFREDLWHRLTQFTILLPPLREHPGDIPLIVEHYLQQEDLSFPVKLHPEALAKLMKHPWHGNVRELFHVINRTLIFHPNQELILPQHIVFNESIHKDPVAVRFDFDPDTITLTDLKIKVEEEYIRKLGEKTGWNAALMAKKAGYDVRTIYRLLKKHDLHNNLQMNNQE